MIKSKIRQIQEERENVYYMFGCLRSISTGDLDCICGGKWNSGAEKNDKR